MIPLLNSFSGSGSGRQHVFSSGYKMKVLQDIVYQVCYKKFEALMILKQQHRCFMY